MNPTEAVLQLPCHPSSVTVARHYVRDLLLGWNLARLVEDAQLGTSELVANAVRHAGTELILTVSSGDSVTIAIRDSDPQLRRPVVSDDDALSESGRGLHIVAAISSDWGITATSGGKIVWFSLALPDDATSDADVLSMERRRPEWSHPSSSASGLGGVSVRSRLDAAV